VSTATAPDRAIIADPAELAERRAWALSLFGLPAGASPQAVRAAVIAHLGQTDLVPPPNWRQAIRVLCNADSIPFPLPGEHDAFNEARENILVEEVNRFTAEFFELPNDRRRGKWVDLSLRAESYPRIRLRLAGLQRGLNIIVPKPAANNPREGILIERLCRLFVLKPAVRESQCRAWLTEMEGDWQRDVRRFRAAHVELATLDIDFLNSLVLLENGPAAAQRVATAAKNRLRENAAAKAKTAAAVRKANQAANTRTSSGPRPWIAGVAVAVILSLFRFWNDSQSHSPNYNYNRPSYNSPSPAQPKLDQETFDRIMKSIQNERSDTNSSPPQSPDLRPIAPQNLKPPAALPVAPNGGSPRAGPTRGSPR
jgi:hypothetical protein